MLVTLYGAETECLWRDASRTASTRTGMKQHSAQPASLQVRRLWLSTCHMVCKWDILSQVLHITCWTISLKSSVLR